MDFVLVIICVFLGLALKKAVILRRQQRNVVDVFAI